MWEWQVFVLLEQTLARYFKMPFSNENVSCFSDHGIRCFSGFSSTILVWCLLHILLRVLFFHVMSAFQHVFLKFPFRILAYKKLPCERWNYPLFGFFRHFKTLENLWFLTKNLNFLATFCPVIWPKIQVLPWVWC